MNIYKQIKFSEYLFSKNLWSDLFWAYKSKFIWNWLEFSDLSLYNYWDNIKSIDWKTSAKKQDLYVKKYVEERDLKVLFLIDISNTFDFWSDKITKFEKQYEVLFTLIKCCIFNNDRYWAIFYDEEIRWFIDFNNQDVNLFKITNYLLNLKQKKSQKSSLEVLKNLKKYNIKNTLIFCVTDDVNLKDEKILRYVNQYNKLIFINIFDYLELNPIKNLDLNIFSMGKNIGNNLFLKNNFSNQTLDLKNTLNKNNIWYLSFDTKTNIYSEFIKYFNL